MGDPQPPKLPCPTAQKAAGKHPARITVVGLRSNDAILLPGLPGEACLSARARSRLTSPAPALVPGQQGKGCCRLPVPPAACRAQTPSSLDRGSQQQNRHCATAPWSCKPIRTHSLLWAPPVSTSLVPSAGSTGNAGRGRALSGSWNKKL